MAISEVVMRVIPARLSKENNHMKTKVSDLQSLLISNFLQKHQLSVCANITHVRIKINLFSVLLYSN